jgi:hypothetical protein
LTYTGRALTNIKSAAGIGTGTVHRTVIRYNAAFSPGIGAHVAVQARIVTGTHIGYTVGVNNAIAIRGPAIHGWIGRALRINDHVAIVIIVRAYIPHRYT